MGALQVQNITIAYGDRDVLKNVSFTLSDGARAALAGGNGSGKTTLLRIVSGDIACDSGEITMPKGMRIAYLPQSDIVHSGSTVYEEAEKGYTRFRDMLQRQHLLEDQLAVLSETDNHEALTLALHEVQEQLLSSSYYQRQAVIEPILKGLGFQPADFHRPCEQFSGGWQMRIALAKVLTESPDVMLLDEPTNYLDIEARIWLRNYLNQFSGSVMIVSHDQDFLDETVNEVYELFNGSLTRYSGNYTAYRIQREQELDQLEKAFRTQQKQIERTEQFIERFRYKATKARQVQSREKQLERLDLIEIPPHLRKLTFKFPDSPHSGNDVVAIHALTKRFGNLTVFDGLDLMVNKGDRLAVTGRNGAGKSTLLRMIARIDTDHGGSLAWGTGVRIGYFAQETEHTLHPELTVYEEVESVATVPDVPRLRSLLGSFLFSDDDVYKRVSVLSGGERSRLALLRILLHPANLLILDEPTNHLDINAKQMLLDALHHYKGTVVFVSHDTHFIKSIANRILYLSEDAPELFEGDYSYFSWKLEQREALERVEPDTQKESGQKPPEREHASLSRKEVNRKKNHLRNLRSEADSILEQTQRIESEIAKTHEYMFLEENYADNSRITRLVAQKEELERTRGELEERWFSLHEEIESLEAVSGV